MDPLLELLHQNATIPRGDLAKMLNLSVEEIDRRIDRYEKDQVILGYQAVVDPEKIDADAVTAFIEVSITPERGGGFDRLAERIARFDEVKSCWLMSGGYDLAILVEGEQPARDRPVCLREIEYGRRSCLDRDPLSPEDLQTKRHAVEPTRQTLKGCQ